MNSLFNMMGNLAPNNQMTQFINQFQQFKTAFNGNPQQQVQQMLNSGRITQEQYNNAVQMANQLSKMMKL